MRDDYLIDRAVGEQLAVGDIGKPVATFGLVHVMRGDEKGQALRGEVLNLLPEVAPRLRIDARGRLIEQQQFRLVNEASRERESLLPPAGELARELLLPLRQVRVVRGFPAPPCGDSSRHTCGRRNRGSRRC